MKDKTQPKKEEVPKTPSRKPKLTGHNLTNLSTILHHNANDKSIEEIVDKKITKKTNDKKCSNKITLTNKRVNIFP